MKVTKPVIGLLLFMAAFSCSKKGDDFQQKIPKGVIFKSVTIRNVPSVDSKGNKWDNDGTGPDIQFTIDDNRGNWVVQSQVLIDADLSQSLLIDFEPDIVLDTFENYQYKWTLYDDDPLLGPSIMTGNFIYYSDYSRDSVILSPNSPRVVMQVEYVF